MGKLDGRVAIVTGGARGQGAATARLFAAEGARVAILDLHIEEGQALAREIGSAAGFHELDITDESGWRTVVDELANRWGSVDILINNAGIAHAAPITQLTKAEFLHVLDINLLGAWLGIKTVAPVMTARRKGAIVNVCSTASLLGMNGLTAYAASKWALRGITKTAAMELGLDGIRVNAIFPGGINTPMGNIAGAPVSELNRYYTRQPIQRIGEPDEVARASLFLASDDASYICGSELAVDGGMVLGIYTDGGGRPLAAEG